MLLMEEILHHLKSPKSWELRLFLGPLGGARFHPSTVFRCLKGGFINHGSTSRDGATENPAVQHRSWPDTRDHTV